MHCVSYRTSCFLIYIKQLQISHYLRVEMQLSTLSYNYFIEIPIIFLIQRNLIDQFQFFFCKRCAGSCFYIVQNLQWLGRADQDTGDIYCSLQRLSLQVYLRSRRFHEFNKILSIIFYTIYFMITYHKIFNLLFTQEVLMKTYTIRELSEMCDLPASTLRYYESEGLLPEVPKSPS